MKRFFATILFLITLLPTAGAHAAWWEFGRESNEPSITDLRFNSIDAARLDDTMILGTEDLQGGAIIVRGRVQVGRGEIGLVEISLDEGKTWNTATLSDRGLFTWEFRPEIGRNYPFRVRATSTTGVSTGPEEHEFHLRVTSDDGSSAAREAFSKLLEAYRNEDRAGFMRHVSDSFEGDSSALDDALMNDFRWLDSISIQANITRVISNSGLFELYFTYNRQVRSTRNGQFLRDSAASVVGFRRGSGGMKLIRMSAPLIFGVSDTGYIATSVTGQAIGQNVLVVDPYTGGATTQSQGTTAGAASSTSGTQSLISGESYNFDTDSVANEGPGPAIQGDLKPEAAAMGFIFLRNGVGFQPIACPISTTASAPAGGYMAMPYLMNAQAGNCYALEMLPGPKYAIIEIVSYNPVLGNLTFRYKYQPGGGRNF
jgi:hypothetical protein